MTEFKAPPDARATADAEKGEGVMREGPGLAELSKRELRATCDALRAHLGAAEVAVWRYYPEIAALSPFVAAGDSARSPDIGSQWMYTPLADLPPIGDALATGRAVRMDATESSRGRVAAFFEDFEISSAWCAPLLLGRPVGLLVIEPAEVVPARLDSTTAELLTTAAAALAWCYADRSQMQAELFRDLAEASGRERLGPILARACQGLARLLGMRRASVFLSIEDTLVPRMSRSAAGTTDAGAWEAFRLPQEPLALAEAVLRSGSPAVAEHPGSPLIAGWWSDRFTIGAALAAPIRSANSTLGVLMVDTDRPRTFTQAHIRLASAVAAQLGGILEIARQSAERDQQLIAAAALNELFRAGVHSRSVLEAAEAVARTTKQVLGVDAALTYLVDKENRITELAVVGVEPHRMAALRRRLVGELASESPVWQQVVEGAEPGPHLLSTIAPTGQVRPGGLANILGLRCLAAIPLMSSDGPLGVVVCGDTTGPRTWRSSERHLLAQLALSTPIVIDNARLRETEHHLATHDGLTGLANRRAFDDQMVRTLASARRSGERVAVLIIDLDRFKQINDTLGHHQGDALLIEVARRLRSALRDADVVARVGGDEFAALLAVTDVAGARAAADRVTDALKARVTLGGAVAQVEASIGISCWPEHGDTPQALLQHADAAMYTAKDITLPSFLYDPAADSHRSQQLGLLDELRRALVEDELVLYYQPKADLRRRETTGVEALVRWQHPVLGLLPPERFVPLAEAHGLIRPLTMWVLTHALEQSARWRSRGLDLSVAVNISAQDLDDATFSAKVDSALRSTGVPATSLIIELTESSLMKDRELAVAALTELRTTGVRISLDDFGTGYSSLAYLQALPLDEIKIDRSFLSQGSTRLAPLFLRTIVDLGHSLGLVVVAEGVDEQEASKQLREIGCDQLQGFVYAPPLDVDQLEAWLEADCRGSRRPA